MGATKSKPQSDQLTLPSPNTPDALPSHSRPDSSSTSSSSSFTPSSAKTLVPDLHSEDIAPLISQVSVGSLAGYATGYALKKLGKVAAFTTGAGFILLQGLSYTGYITVNWRRVETDYKQLLDLDNDGQVTTSDLDVLVQKFVNVLKFNLPSGAGFTAGMFYGMGTKGRTAGAAGLVYSVGGRMLLSRLMVAGVAGTATVGVPVALLELSEKLGIHVPTKDPALTDAFEISPASSTSNDAARDPAFEAYTRWDNYKKSLQDSNLSKLNEEKNALRAQLQQCKITLQQQETEFANKINSVHQLLEQDSIKSYESQALETIVHALQDKLIASKKAVEVQVLEIEKKLIFVDDRIAQQKKKWWWNR